MQLPGNVIFNIQTRSKQIKKATLAWEIMRGLSIVYLIMRQILLNKSHKFQGQITWCGKYLIQRERISSKLILSRGYLN